MRDYKKEYREYHGTSKQKKLRALRNKANRTLSPGAGKEVDHKVPLSKGGSNGESNWRVVSRSTNRKKYDKTAAEKIDWDAVLLAAGGGAGGALLGSSLYGGLTIPGGAAGTALGLKAYGHLRNNPNYKSVFRDNLASLSGASLGALIGYNYGEKPSLINSLAGAAIGGGAGSFLDSFRRKGVDFVLDNKAALVGSKAGATLGTAVGGLPGMAIGGEIGTRIGSKFDKTSSNNTRVRRPRVSVFMPDGKGNIFTQNHQRGFYKFPGGGVFLDEKARDRMPTDEEVLKAANQEALEELGYNLRNSRIVGGPRVVDIDDLEWQKNIKDKSGQPYTGISEHYVVAEPGEEDRSVYNIHGDAFTGEYVPIKKVIKDLENYKGPLASTWGYPNPNEGQIELLKSLLNKTSSAKFPWQTKIDMRRELEKAYAPLMSESQLRSWRSSYDKHNKLAESKGVYLPAKSIAAYKSSDKGKAKLKAAVEKKRKATKDGKQIAHHGLHKAKKYAAESSVERKKTVSPPQSNDSSRLNKFLSSKPIPPAEVKYNPVIKNIASGIVDHFPSKIKPISNHGSYLGKTYGASFRGTY